MNYITLSTIILSNPWWLALLVLIPILAFWIYKNYHRQFSEMKFSSANTQKTKLTFKGFLRNSLVAGKLLALLLLILAMARPQDMLQEEKISTEGIDIVLAMDVSGSMEAMDFEPNRLGAAKKTASDFVDARKNDRIGMVAFAGESFTKCPVTTDHGILKFLMKGLSRDELLEDGTAIGMGLATSINRLKDSQSASKVVILLTDGVNNKGFIDPLTAAETAKEFDIKVYTIGIGTKGQAPYPTRDIFGRTVTRMMEVQIDEGILQQIAEMTGGKYFRATNNTSLQSIYEEIDQLEKTEVEISSIRRYTERFHPLAFIALCILSLDLLLRLTILRGLTG